MAGDKQEEPLKDEAQRRDEWRGGETRLRGDEGSGTLPASEDDDEALGGGGRDEVAHPPTIAPPD